MQLQVPTKIEIKESPGKGLGVFAIKDIVKGEIIEECHILTLPHLNGKGYPVLPNYRFYWPMINPIKFVLPLGYGGIYNHNDINNAYWREHPRYEAFQFYATKPIFLGQEICIYYGGEDYWEKRPEVKLI